MLKTYAFDTAHVFCVSCLSISKVRAPKSEAMAGVIEIPGMAHTPHPLRDITVKNRLLQNR